jgi:hypothetical protein
VHSIYVNYSFSKFSDEGGNILSSVQTTNGTAKVLEIFHDIWFPMENSLLKEPFICYGMNVWSMFFFENVKCFINGFLRKASDCTSDILQQVTYCVMLNAEINKVAVPSYKNPQLSRWVLI